MELSKGRLSSNNSSEAAHVALDQSNSKNISAEVPKFLAFNQARSDQIADKLKQIQVKAFSEIEALSLAQSDINKVFEGFDDELKDMIKEKIKDFEEKMPNNFILISDILENLTKLEETLLNFVKNSFDLASHPIEDTEEDDDEEDKASSSGIMSKEISKPDETGELPKRKKIPSKAMTVLRQWLFENMQDPYPSNEVKEDLAKKTNLSYKQVHNWFINARGRIWKKMVNQERFGNMVEKCYVQNVNENKK